LLPIFTGRYANKKALLLYGGVVLVFVDGIGNLILAVIQCGAISSGEFPAVGCARSILHSEPLSNPRLLVRFALPNGSGRWCSLSYCRSNQKK
jgi:hypothetical protein